MTKRDREKFAALVERCQQQLASERQHLDIWRGDMRAIVAAAQALLKQSKG